MFDFLVDHVFGPIVAVVIVPIAAAVLFWLFPSMRRFVTEMSHPRVRRQIEVSDHASSKCAERSGRIPLQLFRQNRKTLSKLFDIKLYFFKRSSSPKPAFLIVSAETCSSVLQVARQRRLASGGIDIVISLHKYEDYSHLVRSLKHVASKGIFDVILVPIEYLDDHNIQSYRYTVDKFSLVPKSGSSNRIVLRSFRKCSQSDQDEETIRPEMENDRVVWLFLANEGKALPTDDVNLCAGFVAWKQAYNRRKPSSILGQENCTDMPLVREPWLVKTFRVIMTIYLIVVSLIVAVLSSMFDNRLFIHIVSFGCVAISVELIAILTILLIYAVSHLYRFYRYERNKPEWVAGTTGCLRDGEILRSGRGDLWDAL